MNDLFVSAIRDDDFSVLLELPRALLDAAEKDVLDWIVEYKSKYGKMPAMGRVEKEFSFFDASLFNPTDPTRDVYDQFVKARQQSRLATKLINLADDIHSGGEMDSADVSKLLDYTKAADSGLASITDFSTDWFKSEGPSVSIGIPVIDGVIGGLRDADFAVLVGRPGVGKTFLATWLAYRWWDEGYNVLFVSKEMKYEDVLARVAGFISSQNPFKLRKYETLTDEEKQKFDAVSATARSRKSGSLHVPKTPVNTPEDLKALVQLRDYDIVIVDGFYLMSPPSKMGAKWEAVSHISNALKQIASETRARMVGITQLRRGTEKKTLSEEDIAYSDSIGQDADFIFALLAGEEEDEMEFRLIKNRHGRQRRIGVMLTIDHDDMELTIGGDVDWDDDEDDDDD